MLRIGVLILDFLVKLKDFLADRPEWAFLAISMFVNALLFKMYVAARNAHFATVERWLPVTEQLTEMLKVAATKARRSNPTKALPEGE